MALRWLMLTILFLVRLRAAGERMEKGALDLWSAVALGRHPVASLCATLALGLATGVWASPDFSKSEIHVSSESPLEADVVTFTVVLRNTGPDDTEAVYFTTEWPLMGFLVDFSGFDMPEVDHESRRISTSLPVAAGVERRFTVRVLAPRDSGGDALTLATHVAHFATGTEHWDRRTVTIDTRLHPGGLALGAHRITPAGVLTFSVLIGGVLLWIVVKVLSARGGSTGGTRNGPAGLFDRFVGPGAAAAAITISIGFWVLFAVMAWRDYQSLTAWPETTCTILGGRLSAEGTTRTSRTGPGGSRADETNYVPVLGLKYLVDGRETYSSGYDTGSRLGIGGRRGRAEELADWTVGGTTRCWYDPADPLDVVVVNGFGGAYVFALLPIPVFVIGLGRMRSLLAS